MITTVLVDMDGVLSDFQAGALRAHGLDPGRFKTPVPNLPLALGLSPFMFWQKIDQKTNFWQDLPKMPWFSELVATLRGSHIQWYVATAPSLNPNCCSQKVRWMHKHIGVGFHDYVIGAAKHLMANDSTLLVDDSPVNCDKFREHGGHALLFEGLSSMEKLHDWLRR